MSFSRSIIELANSISKDAATVEEYCEKNGLPSPSFDANVKPIDKINDIVAAQARERLAGINDTRELHYLAMGPFDGLRALQMQPMLDGVVFSFLARFSIAAKVPLEKTVSFEELSHACGVPTAVIKSMLRYAMTSHIFAEPREGEVSHTAISRLLKEHSFLNTISELCAFEHVPGMAKMTEAMIRFPACDEPTQSGWALANNASRPVFEELAAEHPDRAARFGKVMDAFAQMSTTQNLVKEFDWASFGSAQVVDIGGGKGPVSIDLARKFPNLNLVVQDLPATVEAARKVLPEDVKDRVRFMEHDFFQPQPIHEADVYYFRAVFHNWPDKYCARILQNLIPAMKKGARVILEDPSSMDPSQGTAWNYRQSLSGTLMMLMFFNAQDRNADEWETLMNLADPRFKIVKVKKPERITATQSGMCLVEVVWTG